MMKCMTLSSVIVALFVLTVSAGVAWPADSPKMEAELADLNLMVPLPAEFPCDRATFEGILFDLIQIISKGSRVKTIAVADITIEYLIEKIIAAQCVLGPEILSDWHGYEREP